MRPCARQEPSEVSEALRDRRRRSPGGRPRQGCWRPASRDCLRHVVSANAPGWPCPLPHPSRCLRAPSTPDRKSTRLNSSHTVIYTLSYTTLFRSASSKSRLSSACCVSERARLAMSTSTSFKMSARAFHSRSEEHTSELQSHSDLHSFLHDALPICVQQVETVFGMLCQRTRQVGHVHFHILQDVCARLPL